MPAPGGYGTQSTLHKCKDTVVFAHAHVGTPNNIECQLHTLEILQVDDNFEELLEVLNGAEVLRGVVQEDPLGEVVP